MWPSWFLLFCHFADPFWPSRYLCRYSDPYFVHESISSAGDYFCSQEISSCHSDCALTDFAVHAVLIRNSYMWSGYLGPQKGAFYHCNLFLCASPLCLLGIFTVQLKLSKSSDGSTAMTVNYRYAGLGLSSSYQNMSTMSREELKPDRLENPAVAGQLRTCLNVNWIKKCSTEESNPLVLLDRAFQRLNAVCFSFLHSYRCGRLVWHTHSWCDNHMHMLNV